MNRIEKPLLVILSGPSGVGKDAVLHSMKSLGYPLFYAVTMTTRLKRDNEKEGVDYYFVSRDMFEQMITNNELLEWANVYGNLYGVPKKPIREAMAKGNDVIIKIDVQGAATIKKIHSDAVFIYLTVPTMEELEKRLRERKTESGVDLDIRLKAARDEFKRLPMFDYIVINHRDRVEHAAAQIASIVTSEKCRVVQRVVEL